MHFIRQTNPNGLGHAILQGKSFIGNEPFVVLLGDDLMADTKPLTKQLMDAYEKKVALLLQRWRCLLKKFQNTA